MSFHVEFDAFRFDFEGLIDNANPVERGTRVIEETVEEASDGMTHEKVGHEFCVFFATTYLRNLAVA